MLSSIRILLPLLLLLASGMVRADGDGEFLPVHEAFKVQAQVEGNMIHYTWTIADGYYLYKHRFHFDVTHAGKGSLGEPQFQEAGQWKNDPIFGKVLIFHHQVDVRVPVTATDGGFVEVAAGYQGCAEKGLCYVPQTFTDLYQVTGAAAAGTTTNTNTPATTDSSPAPAQGTSASTIPANPGMPAALAAATVGQAAPASTPASAGVDTSDALSLEHFLSSSSVLTIVGLFFLLGIALTFTPCVLPMIPILSSIIVGQGEGLSRTRAALLSSTYVLGMATTYAVAGVIAGVSGQGVQVALQSPAVLYSFAAVFVLLSLSMFGFYELQLPAFVRDRLNNVSQRQRGGTYVGVAVIGVLSALIVSPCVSAPLAGALLYIGKTGDWQLGGISLWIMGLGMGAPLVVIGVTGANFLPKAGTWMDNVKALFGVIMLGVALYLIKHLLPPVVLGVGWGLLAILAGLYLGAFDGITSPKGKLFKGLGLASVVAGAAMIFTTLAPAASPVEAVAAARNTPAATPFERIRSTQQLDQALAAARDSGKPVMVDYYADWCTSCQEMEHETFTQSDVQSRLSQYRWLQIDLTNNPDDQALLDRYTITGPPAILFFGRDGQEITNARIYAYKSKPQFLHHLQAHLLAAN